MNKTEIIKQLTIEEKILLLTQGVKQKNFDQTYEIPRLNINVKYISDGPHGVRTHISQNCTSFPNLCCSASSWDRSIMYKMGQALADDCIENGVDLLLGPGANIKRHILCGRNFEYLSEDPVLAGELAAEYIKGLQSKGVGACLKHYALNNQEIHREYESIEVDERVMREIYLKSFEIAIKKSNPVSVMCSYNKVDSIWCSENPLLLRKIMKNEWGYKGIIMSDWGAVHDIRRAISAGLDMQMPRNRNIVEQLTNGLSNGMITEEQIDDSVSRVLDFVTSPTPDKIAYNRQKQHETAREIASSGIVLLKNTDSALPLTSKKYSKITFVGEYANNPLTYGQGSAEVFAQDEYIDSPLEEVKKILGSEIDMQYYEGYKKNEYSQVMLWPKISEYAEFIKDSDAVVVFVGSMESEDTEKFDRRSAQLNPNFELFINKAYAMGKKVIVVIQSGSAVVFENWKNKTHSIVQMWLGGESSGGAIADVLTGKVCPSGKLSETFPTKERTDLEYPGDGLKICYKEGFDVGYRYYDKHPEEICYPFGHGLSYTNFQYSNIKSEYCSDKINISFELSNVGEYDGAEVAQVYIGKDVSCVTRSIKELKDFEKVFLSAGETKKVNFTVDLNNIAYYNRSLHDWVVEPGVYTIYIGSSSQDIRLTERLTVETKPPYSMQQISESMMM